MESFRFYLVYYSLGALSILPWRVLYFLSDIFYVVIRIVGYRNAVILENLRYSFPEKSEKEIKKIRNRFYAHFADLFVEVIKLQTMSEKSFVKHIVFENTEYPEKMFGGGGDIRVAVGHYCNWEWIGAANLILKHQGGAIYKPLKSKIFDKYMYTLRSKTDGSILPMKTVFRDLLRHKRDGIKYIIGVIADQTPPKSQIQHYSCFLNQRTPVHMGLEKMAVKFNDVVVYAKMEKIKRGYYKIKFIPLFENAKETKEFEIIDTVMKYLEEDIRRKPEYWLWSHRRWKHVKENRLCNSNEKNERDEQN